MQKADLLKDAKIDMWFTNIESENTKSSYLQAMYFYTELTGKTPEELINEAINDQVSGKLMLQRNILNYFEKYIYFLNKKQLAPKTIKSYMGGIRSFYVSKSIEVPNIKLKKGKPLEKNEPIPTKEEIQETLEHCNKLEKAIILTGASSGLSDIDIVNLKISQYKKGFDPVNNIVKLQLKRQKTGTKFITFLSPEAVSAINDYLDFRNRDCKVNFQRENDRLDKQRVVSDDGYLFIKKHIRASYLISGNEEERKITDTNLIQIYRGISEKARKNTPSGDWNLIRSHNMRKYFYNVLINHKCPYPHAEHMMGHVLDSVRDAYFVPNEEEVKKSYIECIPYLTIEKKLDISVSAEYKAAIERAEKAEGEAYRANVERNEIQRISTDFEKYKKRNDIESKIMVSENRIQVLRMEQKLDPENAEEIQKTIDEFEKALVELRKIWNEL